MQSPTLAQWVGDTDAFAAHYWRRRPGHFEAAAAASPFTLKDVDAALACGLLRAPYLEMTQAGRGVLAPTSYSSSRTVNHANHDGYADESKIRSLQSDGATLLLRCIDQWHPPTRETVSALAAELGRQVEAFFFVTPAGRQGLPLHRDDADVLVVQAAGSKTWYIHEGPGGRDWRPDQVAEDERPREILRVTLHPGEVLYIPRAFAHRAMGQDGLSAHLSLTVREVAVRDLYRCLQQQLIGGLRLPQRPLDDAALLAASAAMLDHFRRRLEAITPTALVAEARRAGLGRAALPGPSPPPVADSGRAIS